MRGQRCWFASVMLYFGSQQMPAQIIAVHAAVPFDYEIYEENLKQDKEYLKGGAVTIFF